LAAKFDAVRTFYDRVPVKRERFHPIAVRFIKPPNADFVSKRLVERRLSGAEHLRNSDIGRLLDCQNQMPIAAKHKRLNEAKHLLLLRRIAPAPVDDVVCDRRMKVYDNPANRSFHYVTPFPFYTYMTIDRTLP